MHNWRSSLVDPKCICARNSYARCSKCATRSSDRYSFTDNAQEGRKSERRVISTTEKRRIQNSLHGRVLRIDDFSGGRESRNNFTSGTGEQAGCSPPPSRTERRIRDSYIYRAPKESSSLWPTCSPRREIKWFILRNSVWNGRHTIPHPKNARRVLRIHPRPSLLFPLVKNFRQAITNRYLL